jgi:hypothetical protein
VPEIFNSIASAITIARISVPSLICRVHLYAPETASYPPR